MATSTTYNRAFWNVMKGKEENNQNLSEGFDNAGAYVAPDEFREGFNTALAKENIFRRFATVINLSSAEGKNQAVSSTGCKRSSILEKFWPIIFHRTTVLV